MKPFQLRRGLRNRDSAGGAYQLCRFFGAHTECHQHSGCNQAGASDALAAVYCDIPAVLQRRANLSEERECGSRGRRHSAIGNRKRQEFDALRLGGFPFVSEIQLSGLFVLEEGHHDIQAGAAPAGRLIVNPFPAARARGNCQLSAPGTRYPEEVRVHRSFSIISTAREECDSVCPRATNLREWWGGPLGGTLWVRRRPRRPVVVSARLDSSSEGPGRGRPARTRASALQFVQNSCSWA
jgi:hypothetical protein